LNRIEGGLISRRIRDLIESYCKWTPSIEIFEHDKLPQPLVPGCGMEYHGFFIRAIDRLGYNQDSVAAVSGIGLFRTDNGYMDFTPPYTHGRPWPLHRLKMAKPGLKVFVLMGDGDACQRATLIHACRRNID
jgi:pyruvate/2-oxoacid:ferredoxin oxidoreductase beta subunit